MSRSKNEIIILIILVGLIVSNKPLLVTASDQFVPKSEGEVWENEIMLTPEKQWFVVAIQMRAFAQYHISVSIDRFSDISQYRDYIFRCTYSTRAEPKINNEPHGEQIELFFQDDESISFLLNSTVHFQSIQLKVEFVDFKSTKEVPTEGFHGKITIKMISLGVTDHSWYRTAIRRRRIKEFPDTIFDAEDLPNLTEVNLAQNSNFSTLPASLVRTLDQLEIINLKDTSLLKEFRSEYRSNSSIRKFKIAYLNSLME